jgi:Clp amino terminal domain, pathogenicity island component
LIAEGVTLEPARGCLQTTMPGIPLSELERPAEEYAVSAHARRIIEGARREAIRRGDDQVGAEHLLLALLSDSRNGAVQTLEELRANPGRVERQLEREPPILPAPPLPCEALEDQLTSRSRPVSTS